MVDDADNDVGGFDDDEANEDINLLPAVSGVEEGRHDRCLGLTDRQSSLYFVPNFFVLLSQKRKICPAPSEKIKRLYWLASESGLH